MHPYSTDSAERRRVLFILAIVSAVLGMGIGRLLSIVGSQFPLMNLLDAPSAVFLYGVLYTGFNRWGWRTWPVRKLGLVSVPDLRGKWKGHVRSSYDEHEEKHEVEIEIHQRWMQIEINLYTDNSTSMSRTGSIIVEKSVNTIIAYEYLNEPNPDAPPDMHMHKGTTLLTLPHGGDGRVLEGEYYSGRGRQRFGYIHLEKQEDRKDKKQ